VRSPHAHARVLSVKADAARAAKKVLAVLTAADMKAANVGSVSRHPPVPGRGGAKMIMPFRPALAGDKVMHGGDPVAMVVAETAAAAQDAADLVQVDYEADGRHYGNDAMKGAAALCRSARQSLRRLAGVGQARTA
jgi:carbon-monoxide dehydrogenase large subunit